MQALALLSTIFCTTGSNGNSHTVQSYGPSIPISLLGFRNADFLLLLDFLAQRTDLNHSPVGFPLSRCQSKNYKTLSRTGRVLLRRGGTNDRSAPARAQRVRESAWDGARATAFGEGAAGAAHPNTHRVLQGSPHEQNAAAGGFPRRNTEQEFKAFGRVNTVLLGTKTTGRPAPIVHQPPRQPAAHVSDA